MIHIDPYSEIEGTLIRGWTFTVICSNVLKYLKLWPQSGRGMVDLAAIQQKIISFRNERDWAQFHDPSPR
jgi:hypothetical protein